MYLDEFSSWDDVQSEFNIGRPEPEFVFAVYTQEYYCGDAVVFFKDENGWWLVDANHCSCYGLEGQFEPEEFSPETYFEALRQGKDIAPLYGEENKKLLQRFLSEATGMAL